MSLSMYDASAPRFAHMLRNLDAILARTIACVESFATAQVDGSESGPVAAGWSAIPSNTAIPASASG